MQKRLAQRLIVVVVPAMLIASIGLSSIWGNGGIIARWHLQETLDGRRAELARLDRENQQLMRDLQLMEQEPQVLERMVAEETGRARPGTTIYRFDE